MRAQFSSFSRAVARNMGSAYAFAAAAAVVVIWLVTGPIFDYSDTWQLIINTGTTIVTFLMVFVIQNTQNRDSKAIHLKLDELICAADKARLELVDAEDEADEVLERHQREFERARRAGQSSAIEKGGAAARRTPPQTSLKFGLKLTSSCRWKDWRTSRTTILPCQRMRRSPTSSSPSPCCTPT